MHVLYITEIFPDPKSGLGYWGGGERQFYEVATRVAKLGHRVTVLTCRFPGQRSSDFYDGVEVRRAGMSRDPGTGVALRSPVRVAEYLVRTVKAGVEEACDVVHCNAYYPVIAGRAVSAIRKTPMVSTFHDLPGAQTWAEYSGSRSWGWLGYVATVASARLAKGPVISVSEQARARVAPFVGGRLEVIPNGVDAELLGKGGSVKKPWQVLYVGRLVAYKRVDVLLAAFQEVAAKLPDARLVVVGEGPERGALERGAASLPRGRVRFTGAVPSNQEVARLYAESSLFVFPSVTEGEGVALKEAMAAGLPVVAARAPGSGVLGLVRDGWNGALVPPGDARALAGEMLRILSDGEMAKEMGENGRSLAAGWGWDDVAEKVVEVYRRALDRG
ncbi:MAG: glycosyltransferase family 4 protein [Nitrososphaerota archaeon]|nr:glycosyltransferase family 4 protein [Nitrososphaerota archaeon]